MTTNPNRRSKLLDLIGEAVDELIAENENPDPMTPDEIIGLFCDYLESFDAQEFENALKAIHTTVRSNMDDDKGEWLDMHRCAVHLELALEAWQNRKGN